MIWLYSGTPGSGKSLHATKDIINRLIRTKNKDNQFVICNYNLKVKYSDKFFYMDNFDITPDFLIEFALNFHQLGKENQSLLVIDEASILFNCRDIGAKNRKEWIQFFQQHRKLGYNVILITQFDRMLDRQIRCFIEYEIVHRKLNNAGGWGIIFTILHIPMFYTIEKWYGAKIKTNQGFMPFSIKASKAYNTFDLFTDAKVLYQTQLKNDNELEQARVTAVSTVSAFAKYLISLKVPSSYGG